MYAFPKGASAVRWQGRLVRINQGQVWPDDDPFVLAHPDLFSFAPDKLSTTKNPRGEIMRDEVVEQATKAPGEKRAAKRAS